MPGEPASSDDTITTAAELGRVLKGLVRHRPGGAVKVAALAKRLSLSQSTLYAYLAGTTLPPGDVLDDLLGELRVPPGERRRLTLARDALHRRRGTGRPRLPHELPADTVGFTGRAPELAELDAVLSGDAGPPARIASVSGPAGVGKTALAVHWCHRRAAAFPDGCLYTNLHGYSPADPRDPADVLAGFLRSLGVDGDLPDDPAERAARFRSLLAGRRVLILLDNAFDADQTRLLLPGSPDCFVVITSRADLAGLQVEPGAHRIELRPMPTVDGMALLRAHLGSKVDDAADAARLLVDRCDGLPLALRVVAAQAARDPAQPLAELVAELTGQGLDLLDIGDRTTAIGTVFSWSVRHLPAVSAADFALLGAHPVRELDTAGIAALLGTDTRAASRRIDRLVRAHLVQGPRAGRFGMHDLVRQYAADRAEELPAEVREAAVGRLVDHLVERATWAMDVLHPDDPLDPDPGPVAGNPAEAREWLDAEWHNLLAMIADTARRGRPGHTARLADVLRRHLDQGGRHSDALTVFGYALEASRLAGDRAAEGEALRSLGVAYLRLGRHEDAGAAHRAAIAVCRECGDRNGEAAALNNLGNVHERLGHYREAMDHYDQALALADELGARQGKAILLTNLGVVHTRLGNYAQAMRDSRRAYSTFRALGDLGGAARTLSNLGEIRHLAGRPDGAVVRYEQALALVDEIGARGIETEVLNRRGAAHLALGAVDRALADHEAALDIATAIGDRYEEAKAHEWIGHAHVAAGRTDLAAGHWRRSAAVYRQLGVPDEGRVESLLPDH
jgi:tetratricopeptide (TPR) repeat protein